MESSIILNSGQLDNENVINFSHSTHLWALTDYISSSPHVFLDETNPRKPDLHIYLLYYMGCGLT